MPFEDLLKSIADETDRGGISQLAAKYPVLKEAGDVLDSYRAAKPHLQRLKELTGKDFDLPTAAKFATDWQSWSSDNWDRDAGATKSELEAKRLLDETNARLVELENLRTTEMTNEELNAALDKRFQEAGFIRKEELKTMLPMDRIFDKEGKSILATQDDLSRWSNGLSNRFEEIYSTLTPEMVKHHSTFGEPIDVNRVLTVMNEEFKATGRAMKAADGYKKAYEKEFSAKAEEKRTAELKAEREAGIAEGKKAVQQSTGGRAIPIDSRGGLAMGAVARRVQAKIQKDADGKPLEAPLGRGIIAARAAEEFVNKQTA